MELKLRNIRKKANVSQAELADIVNVNIRTIGSWERGETLMNAEQLCDCCRALGTDPNTMLGWYDEHPADAQANQPEIMDLYEGLSAEGREVATNVVAGLVDRYPAGGGEHELVEERA